MEIVGTSDCGYEENIADDYTTSMWNDRMVEWIDKDLEIGNAICMTGCSRFETEWDYNEGKVKFTLISENHNNNRDDSKNENTSSENDRPDSKDIERDFGHEQENK